MADLPLNPGAAWQPDRPETEGLVAKSCAREIMPSWFLSSFTQLDGARILNLIRNPKSGPPASSRTAVARAQLQGFLKGFIDLIFRFEGRYHVVDWKSNLLGNRAEDYTLEAMQRAIQESCYDLQYYIYTVALDKSPAAPSVL